jgi:hypothetical protein
MSQLRILSKRLITMSQLRIPAEPIENPCLLRVDLGIQSRVDTF